MHTWKRTLSTIITAAWLLAISFSCSEDHPVTPSITPPEDLEKLPTDTGGEHTPVYFDPNTTAYGYFVYTPSGYATNQAVYPLLVFLHGSGERGNSLVDTTVLAKVLVHGPPNLITGKKWMPRYPMIVVSPQCHEFQWDPAKIHHLIDDIVKKYRINTHRIYLTGLSMGGYGTCSYLEAYASTGFVAAAVPICGGGNPMRASQYVNTPLWAFHGDADNVVPVTNSIQLVKSINDLNPAVRAKLTIYPGVGHDSWTRTYDGSGMGTESQNYTPFAMSLYDWLFTYSKQ